MPDYKTTMKYNPQTGKVEQTKVEKKSSTTGWVKGDVTFIVRDETLKTLLGLAREDGLDISDKVQRGKAVNTYIRAALTEFVKVRQSRQKQAAEAKTPSQALTQAAAQASPAPAPAKVQSGNGKQAPQARQPVAAAR